MSRSTNTADNVTALTSGTEARRRWLAVLAKAALPELERAWAALPEAPAYRALRAPEIGLAMVRGRIGGTGAPFNIGEMTMTRAVVQLLDAAGVPSFTGFGHVAGRSARHAELVAVFDARLQDPRYREALMHTVVTPLAAGQEAARARKAAEVQATKVEFFTLVRGE